MTCCTSTSGLNQRLPGQNGRTALARSGFAPRRVVVIRMERKSSFKLLPCVLGFQPHARSRPFVSPSAAPFQESMERVATDGTT